MKVAAILALPVLALAAATPKLQDRQLPGLPALPLDSTCLAGISGASACVSGGIDQKILLSNLIGCPVLIVLQALDCIIGGLGGGLGTK